MTDAFDGVFDRLHVGCINLVPPKLEPVPNILLDPDVCQQDTDSEPESDSPASGNNNNADRTNLRLLSRTDGSCFVTGLPYASMQAAYLVNPLRHAPRETSKDQLKKTKELLNEYLTVLEFNRGHPFGIDKRPNLLLLLQNIHSDLDGYGSIAFVPSLPGSSPTTYLLKLAALLTEHNENWDQRYKISKTAKRNLPFTNDLLDMNKLIWTVLVLDPRAISPYDCGILVCRPEHRPTTYTEQLPADAIVVARVFEQPFGPALGISQDTPLHLQAPKARKNADMLSLFAMLVNAHSKIAAFRHKNPNSTKFEEIFDDIHLVRKRIFHLPKGNDLAASLRATVMTGIPATPPIPQPSPSLLQGQTHQRSTETRSSGNNKQSPGSETSARGERAGEHSVVGDLLEASKFHGSPTSSVENQGNIKNGSGLGEADSGEEDGDDTDDEEFDDTDDEEFEEEDEEFGEENEEDDNEEDNEEEEDDDENPGAGKGKHAEVMPGITLDEYQKLLDSVGDPSSSLTTPEIFSMLLFGAQGIPKFKDPPYET